MEWRAFLLPVLLALEGCGLAVSEQDGAPAQDASSAFDGGAGLFPSAPVQLPNQGGALYDRPTVVPVTIAGDPNGPSMDRFLQRWVGSSLYLDTLREYGIRGGTVAAPVQLAAPPCAAPCVVPVAADGTDQLTRFLSDAIRAGRLPRPSAQLVYHLTLPAGVTARGGCDVENAYHDWSPDLGGYAYVVSYVCDVDELSALDVLTLGASHELAEAITDPGVDGNPAFYLPWDTEGGGEICDYCQWSFVTLDEFKVVRIWSNLAASQGRAPCVPYGPGVPSSGTYGAAPLSDAPLPVTRSAGPASLRVRVFATADQPGPFRVSAGTGAPGIQLSPSGEVTLAPGDEYTFTVSADASAATGDSSLLLFAYPVGHPTRSLEWPVHLVVR